MSRALQARIAQAVEQAGGFLSFEHFMDLALYAPGLGYYVAGARKFGADGDFVTAPELTPLFGACLARQCAAVLACDGGSVLEFGGGSGRLALSVLQALDALGQPAARYTIVELSPELRERQQALIAREAPALLPRIAWRQAPPEAPWEGIVLANEVLDALPCARFARIRGEVRELGVERAEDGSLRAASRVAQPAFAARVNALLAPLGAVYPRDDDSDYVSEFSPRLPALLADLARFLRRGMVVFADYGEGRREYYAPQRADGTLQCYYRHRAHVDPLWWPGLQDITAAVDFTAVAEAAAEAGFEIAGFMEQAPYLLACGITDLLGARAAAVTDGAARANYQAAQAAKLLLLPQEMGTRVKIMTLARGSAAQVVGDPRHDLRHRL